MLERSNLGPLLNEVALAYNLGDPLLGLGMVIYAFWLLGRAPGPLRSRSPRPGGPGCRARERSRR